MSLIKITLYFFVKWKNSLICAALSVQKILEDEKIVIFFFEERISYFYLLSKDSLYEKNVERTSGSIYIDRCFFICYLWYN